MEENQNAKELDYVPVKEDSILNASKKLGHLNAFICA